MTVLFTPIAIAYGASTVAGSGLIVRWTYTVPPLTRAVILHSHVGILVSAAAANTALVLVRATIGGIVVQIVRLCNAAVLAAEIDLSYSSAIELSAGDVVTGSTQNTAAVAVTMIVSAVIREYR